VAIGPSQDIVDLFLAKICSSVLGTISVVHSGHFIDVNSCWFVCIGFSTQCYVSCVVETHNAILSAISSVACPLYHSSVVPASFIVPQLYVAVHDHFLHEVAGQH
jgi:hypothetical protein